MKERFEFRFNAIEKIQSLMETEKNIKGVESFYALLLKMCSRDSSHISKVEYDVLCQTAEQLKQIGIDSKNPILVVNCTNASDALAEIAEIFNGKEKFLEKEIIKGEAKQRLSLRLPLSHARQSVLESTSSAAEVEKREMENPAQKKLRLNTFGERTLEEKTWQEKIAATSSSPESQGSGKNY